MAITTAMAVSYKAEVLQGIHQPGDTYMMALYTSAATLDATTTIYDATNEVAGTGYVAGGTALANFTVGSSGITAWVTFDTPTWPGSTITARGALIYNATQGNRALGAFDFGSDITSSASTFTATIPAAAAATALLRIT